MDSLIENPQVQASRVILHYNVISISNNSLHSKYLQNFMHQKCSAHSTLLNTCSPIIIAGNPHKSNSVFYRDFVGTQARWNSCLRVSLSITASSNQASVNITCHSSVMLTCFIKILAAFSKAGKLIDSFIHSLILQAFLQQTFIIRLAVAEDAIGVCSEAFMLSPGYLWGDRLVEKKLGNDGSLLSLLIQRRESESAAEQIQEVTHQGGRMSGAHLL